MRTASAQQDFETSQLNITGVAQLLSDEMKRSANRNSHEIDKPRDVGRRQCGDRLLLVI